MNNKYNACVNNELWINHFQRLTSDEMSDCKMNKNIYFLGKKYHRDSLDKFPYQKGKC